MQKARRLMDENSVSFQMFLILLSSRTLGSESQISVLTMSEQYLEVCFVLFWFFFCAGEACAEAQFNFSRLSLAFILKYYPILHVVKR